MRIKKIQIKNFKSLVDFEIEDLKPFCAFVGPNASGKSNIFEALEFTNYLATNGFGTFKFNKLNDIISFNSKPFTSFNHPNDPSLVIEYIFEDNLPIDIWLFTTKNEITKEVEIESIGAQWGTYRKLSILDVIDDPHLDVIDILHLEKRKEFVNEWKKRGNRYDDDYEQFIDHFSRIFVGKSNLIKIKQSANKLLPDASNLSQIIGQIFNDIDKITDFVEWIRILIPEFENIEVKKSNIDGSFEFFIYERGYDKPFPKNLISDGTYNILSLMAAVYQTDQPQFLCIEEPENGLHPEAIELLVDFFREKCDTKGHHIWLNTHSPTLVRCMEIDEIVLVNKINGETRAKKIDNASGINIKTDEAWLSNALGGGVSWSK